MINKINFFTPIRFEGKKTLKQHLREGVGDYFYRCGKCADVIFKKASGDYQEVIIKDRDQSRIQQVVLGTLKVTSYMAVGIPLIGLAAQRIFRAKSKFCVTQQTKAVNSKGDRPVADLLSSSQTTDRLTETLDSVPSTQKKHKKIAYLFSSGGGGHKAVKEALKERHASSKKIVTTERDVLHDFLGAFGKKMSKTWDDAQQSGNISKIKRLAKMQPLSDFLFGRFIYRKTLNYLIQERPTELHSTQAMALPSIVKAVDRYNKKYRQENDPELVLNQHMTDLPSEHAEHFFRPIRKIARKIPHPPIKLYAPKASSKDFYKRQFGDTFLKNNLQVVEINELPVRKAFNDAANQFKEKKREYDPTKIELKVSGEEELNFLKGLGVKTTKIDEKSDGTLRFTYELGKDDHSTFLMLGSQPTHSTIEAYIDQMVKTARVNPDQSYHLFAFTGKYTEKCFFKTLAEKLKQRDLPNNLSVIPLTYQDAPQLVDLYLRSDTITRSGGSTCYEILIIRDIEEGLGLKRKRLVHAEVVEKKPTEEQKRAALYVWEGENYDYLKRAEVNVDIVTPA